jgi:hypothetical protein
LTKERRSGDGMLGKGLRLLVALGDHPEGAGFSRLAREVQLHRDRESRSCTSTGATWEGNQHAAKLRQAAC